MSRYVDVDILKKQDFQDYSDTDVEYAIDHCPTADVVKVVRCKACKYWDNVKLYAVSNKKRNHKGVGLCIRRGATNGEDFCSYGERKDEK